jgi:hypothetical protein
MVIIDDQGRIVTRVQTLAEPMLYPGPDVGQRVRSVTVPIDEHLDEKVGALMNELEWVGMTSLMFILPSDGGKPMLTDFNSRCVASSDQYIAAGVNFPTIWACLMTGRTLPTIGAAEIGKRFQWLEGDLRRAIRERRAGFVRDIVGCLLYARGAAHTLWRRDDPTPALSFGARLIREIIERLARAPRSMESVLRSAAKRINAPDRASAAQGRQLPGQGPTIAKKPTSTPKS